jgi:hypothetical protein
MNINEKKQDIIHLVQNTNDELLIDEMYSLLHTEDAIKNIEFDKLPQELQIKLFRAVEDYKQGRYITHEQMKLKVQEWLMK